MGVKAEPRIWIVHGPTGCGKSYNAEQLRAHFMAHAVLDEVSFSPYTGKLHWLVRLGDTTLNSDKLPQGTLVVLAHPEEVESLAYVFKAIRRGPVNLISFRSLVDMGDFKCRPYPQEGSDKPYDIVFVYGPQGCGKTTNMYRIAEHFNLNVIRDDCPTGEWPYPLSVRDRGERILYLSNTSEWWEREYIPRLVKEGFRVLLAAYEDLDIPGVSYPID